MSWMLSPEAVGFLMDRLPPLATIVELGSGEGTARLCEFAEVYSVEHDEAWLGKVRDTHYVHAPIVGDWYDPEAIRGKLPAKYDCIVVDGPPGNIGRMGMLRHLDLFRPVPLVVDDVNRPQERELAIALARSRELPFSIHCLTNGRAFATIGWTL